MHGNRNESTTFSHFKKKSGNEEAGRFMGLAFKILLKEKKGLDFGNKFCLCVCICIFRKSWHAATSDSYLQQLNAWARLFTTEVSSNPRLNWLIVD